MHTLTRTLLALVPLLPLVLASPLFGINFGKGTTANGAPTPVSQSDITNNLLRPAQFSRVVYCPSSKVTSWSCGGPCQALPGVHVLTAGGNEAQVPYYFIAQDAQTQSVVVAHGGTDPYKLFSDLNDAEFKQVPPNATRFPKASGGTQVHDGFHKAQGRTADLVLSTVRNALASSGYKNVLVTGHSLGAAVASLDAVMLRMALPGDVQVGSIVFGLPRVGNQQWADLVDSLVRLRSVTTPPTEHRPRRAALGSSRASRTSRTSRTRFRACPRSGCSTSTPRARRISLLLPRAVSCFVR
ncbi:hypothetical protein SCP_0805610 [Sparassis crispa]|uniref:Fungal lipase-type domain-containing protein n=1 Tax=Sparassis crispa TaxID=139825 RepID=A0A401GUX5_9APHY|nr:hypothetical protein SCP_0805610 [Sparassis crispa]GBE86037.1 hypothetical protein SCP_0805610 [Sparassis crispa]